MLEHLVWRFPGTYRPLCNAHWPGIGNPQIHPSINHKHYLSAYQRIDTPSLLCLNRHKRMAYHYRISNCSIKHGTSIKDCWEKTMKGSFYNEPFCLCNHQSKIVSFIYLITFLPLTIYMPFGCISVTLFPCKS